MILQMKIIHLNGFTDQERVLYRSVVFSNTAQSLKVILEAMVKLRIEYGSSENQTVGQSFVAFIESKAAPAELD